MGQSEHNIFVFLPITALEKDKSINPIVQGVYWWGCDLSFCQSMPFVRLAGWT